MGIELAGYTEENPDHWSYRGNVNGKNSQAFFQYPAMMVPQMQGDLIRAARKVVPGLSTVYDPFVGSGTVLGEAMKQGLSFFGQDINPLAVLLCRAKAGPFDEESLRAAIQRISKRLALDTGTGVEVEFAGRDKWFRTDVQTELSRIRRAVCAETDATVRRFLWVALAETVRLTSNSRTSTFKLHIRPSAELERELDPMTTFTTVVSRNLEYLRKQREFLSHQGWLQANAYDRPVSVQLGDSSVDHLARGTASQCDLLVTSPPYGDNVSCVPYGQHSFLPLQWIQGSDIDQAYDAQCLATTHTIDGRSVGGRRAKALAEVQPLLDRSPTLKATLDALRGKPRDRSVRVAAYCRDLDRCLNPILRRLNPNAYMFWTVGNRRVGGSLVPTDKILCELLLSRGVVAVTTITRGILSKRMAHKNSIAATMSTETILVMRTDEQS